MSKEHLLWVRNYFNKIYKTNVLENFLNLEILDVEEGKVKYRAKIIDKHCNVYGYAHGGTFASIADAVMGVSCVTLGKRVVTTDMGISYIKNVHTGSTITAVGKVISRGNTIIRAVGEIYDEHKELLVSSHASYFVVGDFDKDDYPETKDK
ncbi:MULTISPECIES: PaaI family thioesterase [Clostridium]|uniref:PaaI family thioesterase n=1 Tax=Clostridium TaxID=1485 RepID=UPI0008258B26|nr:MULTISPECIES: PaaI family thioesterase [Clostridium]PJI08673.1 PaaI family thioesterase [Clostridium sp. CT7]